MTGIGTDLSAQGGSITILGAQVLRPGGFAPGPLAVVDGRVAAAPALGAPVIRAEGALALPGIVDLHGDAFERQIMPRPGVTFDLDVALVDTDRQLAANGITSAYHGLSVTWEPGLRSREAGRIFVGALRALRPRLLVDTRLHVRWEVFAEDAADEVLGWLDAEDRPILAFNDHTTNLMRGGHIMRKLGRHAERAGLSPDAYLATAEAVWARREAVATLVERMAATGLAVGATLLAHDETDPAERRRWRGLGALVSEFPMTRETAAEARGAGESVILGAPNVLRGGSHNGALDAGAAAADGLCDVLASDYYYPALLHAPFRLARTHGIAFADAWAMASTNPARAARLDDRGALVEGLRGDVVLVREGADGRPELLATIVAGQLVHGAGALIG